MVSKPDIEIDPEVGLSIVAIIRSVVVLPAPLGPIKPNILPGLHSKEMLSTALKILTSLNSSPISLRFCFDNLNSFVRFLT